MEPKKFSLCPLCEACPEVVITVEGVTIGEDATLNGTNSSRSSSAARLAKFNEVGRGSFTGPRHLLEIVDCLKLVCSRPA